MTTLQQWAESDTAPWTKENENVESLSAAAIFAKKQTTSAALVWGYYGGLYNGNTISDGTVTLTNAADNYVVVLRSTGVVSVSTSSTNSLDPLYAKLYKITTAGSVVTATVDQRWDANGLFFNASGATADMVLGSAQTVTGAKTFSDGALKLAGSSSGALILAAPAAAGSGTVTLPASGTLATTADVGAAVNGLAWKQTVRVATTADGALATAYENGDTVDGVVLATGNRILLKNQSSGAENGIYVVAASGAPSRAADADSGDELINASVYVSEGTANADTQWTCTTNATITVGSTSLTFAQVASGVYQPLDSDLTTIAGLTATTDNFLQAKASAWASRTVAQVQADLEGTGLGATEVGFRIVPSNSQSANYTTVAADSGYSIDHPSTDANARTFTIDSNANVAYPVGTCLTFTNMVANVLTIAIASDTMYLAGTGTTGSRSLAQYGVATARKLTSTTWLISGTGLT